MLACGGGEGFLPAAGFLAGGGVGKRGEKAGRELYPAAMQTSAARRELYQAAE